MKTATMYTIGLCLLALSMVLLVVSIIGAVSSYRGRKRSSAPKEIKPKKTETASADDKNMSLMNVSRTDGEDPSLEASLEDANTLSEGASPRSPAGNKMKTNPNMTSNDHVEAMMRRKRDAEPSDKTGAEGVPLGQTQLDIKAAADGVAGKPEEPENNLPEAPDSNKSPEETPNGASADGNSASPNASSPGAPKEGSRSSSFSGDEVSPSKVSGEVENESLPAGNGEAPPEAGSPEDTPV